MGKERIYETMKELIMIDSEARDEGKFHEHLVRSFRGLGLETIEDNSMETTGLGANNLIARLAGNADAMPLFFCCHTDTVTPGKGIVPVREGDFVTSQGDTILAADDKAGIAIMIELVHMLKEQNAKHGTIEFVLCPGEEIGLIGSKELDESLMTSDYGFVLDSGGPVGGMVVKSPNLYSMEFHVKGKPAHAGLEPEKGVSAIQIAAEAIASMRLGRLDEYTTANIGTINGGTAINIVAAEVKVTAEARAVSDEVIDQLTNEMAACFEKAAAKYGGEVSHSKKLLSKGYDLSEKNTTVRLAMAAAKEIGREVRLEFIGGGSDANALFGKGKEALNMSIGYEKVHTTDETVSLAEMQTATDLIYRIVTVHAFGKE